MDIFTALDLECLELISYGLIDLFTYILHSFLVVSNNE